MITDQPPLDWTCDADGLSDSSPKFLQVMAHIQDLINSNTHHILMPERATTLARLITAQIAHIDHLVPADDHRSALQEANETFVSPVFLNIVSSPEARELQAIDNILARRTALDDFKSRGEKIFAAIDRAAEADRFEKQWREEHALSDSYVRIRYLVDALNIPGDWPPSSVARHESAVIQSYTEHRVKKLVDDVVAYRHALHQILNTIDGTPN